MAGNPQQNSQQYGENLPGHVYRCSCCLHDCPPLMPDNCTFIPVCLSCWKQISASNKLMIVTFAQNTKAMKALTTMIQEYLGFRGIMVGKIRPDSRDRPGDGN